MDELINIKVEHSTLIRAPKETVFDAITTGKGLDDWFTDGARVERKKGGWIKFRWTEERTHVTEGIIEDGGPVIEVDIPNRFVFQWSPDNPNYKTTVTLTFREVTDGTLVKVEEEGFHDTPEGKKAQIGCATGWGEALTLLKFYLEHGVKY